MVRALLLIIMSFTTVACSTTASEYDFDSVREITESSPYFYYSSYSYKFKTKRIDGSNRAIANSYDNVVRIETSRDYHYVSISIEALKSHLLKTPKEQSLLESSNNILLDTGKSFDFEKIKRRSLSKLIMVIYTQTILF